MGAPSTLEVVARVFGARCRLRKSLASGSGWLSKGKHLCLANGCRDRSLILDMNTLFDVLIESMELGYFQTQEYDRVRIEACDTCKHYIKGVDLTRFGLAIPLG